MSNTKRQPLLSDEKMEAMLLSDVVCKRVADDKMQSEATGYGLAMGGGIVREVYEAARAKDAELIQQLVDALKAEGVELDAATAAGFKP